MLQRYRHTPLVLLRFIVQRRIAMLDALFRQQLRNCMHCSCSAEAAVAATAQLR
jgi:hypothetical protein